MTTTEKEEHPTLTRREALLLSVILALATLFKRSSSQTVETSEVLALRWENIVMIDFASSSKVPFLIQEAVWARDEFVRRIVGKENMLTEIQLVTKYGPDITKYGSHAQKELLNDHPELALAYGVISRFDEHGMTVSGAMRTTLRLLESPYPNKRIFLVPLQEFITVQKIEFGQDSLGNYIVSFVLPPEGIIKALERYQTQKVINFSFQVGEIGFALIQREIGFLYEPIIATVEPSDTKYYYLKPIDYKGQINSEVHIYTEDGTEIRPISPSEFNDQFSKNPNIKYEVAGRTIHQAGETRLESYFCIIPEGYTGTLIKRMKYFLDNGTELVVLPENEVPKYMHEHQGKVDLKIPRVEIRDAYIQERAVDSLQSLFKICNAFPDKLFCVASGNTRDDIREARKQLSKTLPANLLIIGEWRGGDEPCPEGNVHGADIYVELKPLGIKYIGSSHATPVISAIASELIVKYPELSIEELKKRILSFCDAITYVDSYGIETTANVLNPDKVII